MWLNRTTNSLRPHDWEVTRLFKLLLAFAQKQLNQGTPDIYVIMMVADTLAPNRRQVICNHHADSAMTIMALGPYHTSCISRYSHKRNRIKGEQGSATHMILQYWWVRPLVEITHNAARLNGPNHRASTKILILASQQYKLHTTSALYITRQRTGDQLGHMSPAGICRHYHFDTLPSRASHSNLSWWRHQMETFSALLVLCAGNSPVTGEFPSQRPVTRSFDVVFDLRLTKTVE